MASYDIGPVYTLQEEPIKIRFDISPEDANSVSSSVGGVCPTSFTMLNVRPVPISGMNDNTESDRCPNARRVAALSGRKATLASAIVLTSPVEDHGSAKRQITHVLTPSGTELVDKDLPVLSSELTWSRESATPSDDMVERFREVCSALVDKLSTHQAEDAQDTVVREFISSLWDIDLVPRTSTDGPDPLTGVSDAVKRNAAALLPLLRNDILNTFTEDSVAHSMASAEVVARLIDHAHHIDASSQTPAGTRTSILQRMRIANAQSILWCQQSDLLRRSRLRDGTGPSSSDPTNRQIGAGPSPIHGRASERVRLSMAKPGRYPAAIEALQGSGELTALWQDFDHALQMCDPSWQHDTMPRWTGGHVRRAGMIMPVGADASMMQLEVDGVERVGDGNTYAAIVKRHLARVLPDQGEKDASDRA